MTIGLRLAGVCTLIAMTLSVRGQEVAEPVADAAPAEQLSPLVATYFATESSSKRRDLLSDIEKAADGSIDAVATAIRAFRPRLALAETQGVLELAPSNGKRGSEKGETVSVSYLLPADYDPSRGYPLLLCYRDKAMSPEMMIALASHVLGPAVNGCVIVCPHEPVGGSFYRPDPDQPDLPAVLREIRTRIHLNAERMFVFGYGEGGNAAWTAAIMHADTFAGAVIVSGVPRLPYPQQVYPILLPNLRSVPVAAGWYKPDEAAPSNEAHEVAAHNRAIVEFARLAKLPIKGFEMEGVEPPRPSAELAAEIARVLAGRQKPPAHTVGHWFRYPSQGHAGWLTQTQFKDDVWVAEQLAILPAAQTDADAYITEIVKDRLAFLGGSVDGQALEIETHRCAEVAVSFEPGLVDLGKPVTVCCNGTVRHDGLITPSIATLLETAYAQWEFQRLTVAKLTLTVRSEAEED